MKRILFLALLFVVTSMYAQSGVNQEDEHTARERIASGKISEEDVLEFKQGMLDAARKSNSSLPAKVNEYQTLYFVGVLNDLIVYKYEIEGWPSSELVSDSDIASMKKIAVQNLLNSQQFPTLFLRCLKTGLRIQNMFFDEARNYIGGYTISYEDYDDVSQNDETKTAEEQSKDAQPNNDIKKPSVAGVSLGDEYSSVENMLEKRYGRTDLKIHDKIIYEDITVGGIIYDYALFDFSYKESTQDMRLHNVILASKFKLSEVNTAKEYRDNIASVYSRKYKFMSVIDENGFKEYCCFLYQDPILYLIKIGIHKTAVDEEGKTFYCVSVNYSSSDGESDLDDI